MCTGEIDPSGYRFTDWPVLADLIRSRNMNFWILPVEDLVGAGRAMNASIGGGAAYCVPCTISSPPASMIQRRDRFALIDRAVAAAAIEIPG
jgi:hypothetical protein